MLQACQGKAQGNLYSIVSDTSRSGGLTLSAGHHLPSTGHAGAAREVGALERNSAIWAAMPAACGSHAMNHSLLALIDS